MFDFRIPIRQGLLAVLLVAGLLAAPAVHAAARNFTLVLDQTQSLEDDKDVQTWDDDVINLTVEDPGVLHIEAAGADVQGLASSEDICNSGSRSMASTWLPLTKGRRSIPVQPGTWSLEIQPHGVSWVQHHIRFRLGTFCPGSSDDHGDDPLCSTDLCSGVSQSAQIESLTPADQDYFSFVVTSQASITIESTGSTDVEGELYDEEGARLADDDDSGTDSNFKIIETLDPGRYFVRVRGVNGATGSYSVSYQ